MNRDEDAILGACGAPPCCRLRQVRRDPLKQAAVRICDSVAANMISRVGCRLRAHGQAGTW